MRTRPFPFGLPLRALAVAMPVLLGAPLAIGKTEPESAPKKPATEAPPLRFAHTYAEAMAEAKDRGCVVFATIHEDGCSWCEKQDKEVFSQAEFKTWAADNVVFLLGYKGHEHEHGAAAGATEGEAPADGAAAKPASKTTSKKAPAGTPCLKFPGITCEEHEQVVKDVTDGTGGPKLAVQGFPTSYMITPDGKLEQHKKDRVVKDLIDGVAEFAKKSGLKPSKKYQGYLAAFADGDKAMEAGKWKDATAALQKVDAVAKKTPSLGCRLPSKLDALNDKVVEAFGKLRDAEGEDATARIKAIRTLRADVGARFVSLPAPGTLPVVADLDAWLKANPMPAATPPGK